MRAGRVNTRPSRKGGALLFGVKRALCFLPETFYLLRVELRQIELACGGGPFDRLEPCDEFVACAAQRRLRVVPDEAKRNANKARAATLRDFVREETWLELR